MQERPQGIIHMKITTICLLKPASSNSRTNCSRVLGDLLWQVLNPRVGGGGANPPTGQPTTDKQQKGTLQEVPHVPAPSTTCRSHSQRRQQLKAHHWRRLTSLHTNMVPNTTCRPSKKLSPMMITVAPPVVQPSLGLMALMHGVAAHTRQRTETLEYDLTSGAHAAHLKSHWRPREEGHAAPPGTGKGQS